MIWSTSNHENSICSGPEQALVPGFHAEALLFISSCKPLPCLAGLQETQVQASVTVPDNIVLSKCRQIREEAAPDNSIPFRHLAGAQGQASGDDCRKALWNGGNCQGDCDLEVVDAVGQREPDRPPVRHRAARLAFPGQEVVVVDEPNQDADNKYHLQ